MDIRLIQIRLAKTCTTEEKVLDLFDNKYFDSIKVYPIFFVFNISPSYYMPLN